MCRFFLTFFLIKLLFAKNIIFFEKAEKHFFLKEYSHAESLLSQLILKSHEHPKAYSLLGDIALQKKDFLNALKYYRMALKFSKNPGKEYFRIGQVYIELDQAKNARESFNNAFLLDPSLKASLFQSGYVSLVLERDKEKTIFFWQRFVDESPNDFQTPKIKAIISLLKDSNFKIPSRNSEISLEEILLLGGKAIKAKNAKTVDKTAGHEKAKTSNKTEELLDDEEL